MPSEDVPRNAFHAFFALLRRLGQFVRESAVAAPTLALLTATKLLPAPIAVALGLVLAFLLPHILPPHTKEAWRLRLHLGGRTSEAVVLLLAAAAVSLILDRPIKSWLIKRKGQQPLEKGTGASKPFAVSRPPATHAEPGIRPALPLGRPKGDGAARSLPRPAQPR